jgi:hypothetical protein
MVSFSVLSLFSSGEQGAWYDPSDFSTMFQDSAGTTPVTAVEQPVGLILDKSKGLAIGAQMVVANAVAANFTGGTNITVADESAGVIRFTNVAGGPASVNIPVTATLTTGARYVVSFDVFAPSADTTVNVGRIVSGSDVIAATSEDAWQTKTMITAYTSAIVFQVASIAAHASAGDYFLARNISIKQIAGNHASQATSTSRPVLSARVNLLTYSEQFDNAAWTKELQGTASLPVVTANAGTDPFGGSTADRVQFARGATGTSDRSRILQSPVLTANTDYTFSVWMKSFGGSNQNVVTLLNYGAGSYVEQTVTGAWQKFTVTLNSGASTTSQIGLALGYAVSSTTAADILVWGADLRVTNDGVGIPAYQRINAATDYDTSGFPLYLAFDGVDDSLSTASVDFSATDKMSVFAGVRKLSDAATGVAAELSANSDVNAGSFYVVTSVSAGNYQFQSGGSSRVAVATNSYPAPTTNVFTGLGDIAGDAATLRVNALQVSASAGDQGTGNYGNYPLYIGRRAGTSLPYNGRIYSLIVRGASTNADQISRTEAWVNNITKAF